MNYIKSFNKNLLQNSNKEFMAKEYNLFCLRPYLTPFYKKYFKYLKY